jgi:thiol-disulfide isomerase/thioredoxin
MGLLDTIIENGGKIIAVLAALVILCAIVVMYRVERYGASPRVVTLYYTNWCGHCAKMKPVWEQVRASCRGRGIVFAESDEEKNHTPGIDSYPTIRMVTEYGVTEQYRGRPDFTELNRWVTAVRSPWV